MQNKKNCQSVIAVLALLFVGCNVVTHTTELDHITSTDIVVLGQPRIPAKLQVISRKLVTSHSHSTMDKTGFSPPSSTPSSGDRSSENSTNQSSEDTSGYTRSRTPRSSAACPGVVVPDISSQSVSESPEKEDEDGDDDDDEEDEDIPVTKMEYEQRMANVAQLGLKIKLAKLEKSSRGSQRSGGGKASSSSAPSRDPGISVIMGATGDGGIPKEKANYQGDTGSSEAKKGASKS